MKAQVRGRSRATGRRLAADVSSLRRGAKKGGDGAGLMDGGGENLI
jgi:hypothetical protein